MKTHHPMGTLTSQFRDRESDDSDRHCQHDTSEESSVTHGVARRDLSRPHRSDIRARGGEARDERCQLPVTCLVPDRIADYVGLEGAVHSVVSGSSDERHASETEL